MTRNRREEEILEVEEQILRNEHEILHYVRPRLASIKTAFSKGITMATAGPITLTTAGQTATASVIGYDQFGNVFTGAIPTPTFSSSDSADAIVTFDPTTGLTTAVANGVATISASVQTTDANGNPVTLTDSETVTVAITVVPPPTPVLTSIKVAFA
jgi:hypothetical protein